MKKWLIICGLLLSVVIVCIPSHAQTPILLDTDPPPMAAPQTLVKRSGTASAKYEKHKDITYSNSASIALKLPDSGWGSLGAGFISKGNGVSKPYRVVLNFFTAAKDRTYVDMPNVVVIADGKKIFDGRAEIKDARTNGSEVYGSFEISIPLSDFSALVKAEKFGVSIGPAAWWVPKAELSKFNDLLGLF